MKTTLMSVFTEYMKLSYIPTSTSIKNFVDYKIDEYILCRELAGKISIHYLYNGACFSIPVGWVDIFKSFNVCLGSRLDYIKLLDEDNSDIEVIIYLMAKLFMSLESKLINTQSSEVLELLGELSIRSTENFRDWCKEEFGYELEPLEFISLSSNIKI